VDGWSVARTVIAESGLPFSSFVMPKPLVAKGRQYMTQVLVPHLPADHAIDGNAQIHLVRPPGRGLLFPKLPGAPDRVFVVTVIGDKPASLPGTPTFLGGLPATWPEGYHRAKALADPANVLE
jgi:hypothetical protein